MRVAIFLTYNYSIHTWDNYGTLIRELEIYNKGKQINYYPFDNVVSDVSSVFKNLDVSNPYMILKF